GMRRRRGEMWLLLCEVAREARVLPHVIVEVAVELRGRAARDRQALASGRAIGARGCAGEQHREDQPAHPAEAYYRSASRTLIAAHTRIPAASRATATTSITRQSGRPRRAALAIRAAASGSMSSAGSSRLISLRSLSS